MWLYAHRRKHDDRDTHTNWEWICQRDGEEDRLTHSKIHAYSRFMQYIHNVQTMLTHMQTERESERERVGVMVKDEGIGEDIKIGRLDRHRE